MKKKFNSEDPNLFFIFSYHRRGEPVLLLFFFSFERGLMAPWTLFAECSKPFWNTSNLAVTSSFFFSSYATSDNNVFAVHYKNISTFVLQYYTVNPPILRSTCGVFFSRHSITMLFDKFPSQSLWRVIENGFHCGAKPTRDSVLYSSRYLLFGPA